MRHYWLRALGVSAALAVVGSAALPQSLNGAAAAAVVNGETITVDDWVARMQGLRYQDFILSPNPFRPKLGTAGQIAMEGLVNGKLVLQYAKKVSLLPSDPELDVAVAEAKKQPSISNALQSKLMSETALRDDLRLQKALYNVATVNRTVTADEVAQFYASHLDSYGQPEQWRIAVIRVTGKPAADKVTAELKAGKPFEQVAAQLSEDGDTKQRGGELGTFAATDPSIPAFIRDGVSKLKVGETTPALLATQPGTKPVYFFIRLLAKKDRSQPPLDQVRPMVVKAALFEKVGGGTQKLAEIRKDSNIVVSLPGYQEMFKK